VSSETKEANFLQSKSVEELNELSEKETQLSHL
jgi:hypothetical protein